MLVFIKARERSELATPTPVATSSLRLLLASLAGSHARLPQESLTSLAHLCEKGQEQRLNYFYLGMEVAEEFVGIENIGRIGGCAYVEVDLGITLGKNLILLLILLLLLARGGEGEGLSVRSRTIGGVRHRGFRELGLEEFKLFLEYFVVDRILLERWRCVAFVVLKNLGKPHR